MTKEEEKLVDDNAIKGMQALKDIDPRLGKPLGEKILKLLRRGTMVDSGNRLIRGPRMEKVSREIPRSFSPSYQMGENMQTTIGANPIAQPWLAKDDVASHVSRAYDIQRIEGQLFDMADEAPEFRARQLYVSGQAKLISGAAVSHEVMDDGYVRYYLWYQPSCGGCWVERNRDGRVQSSRFELVEWTGTAGLNGFPKNPCTIYMDQANVAPYCYCYEGEPIEGKWFRIPRQRKKENESEASKERRRKQFIDDLMAKV